MSSNILSLKLNTSLAYGVHAQEDQTTDEHSKSEVGKSQEQVVEAPRIINKEEGFSLSSA